MSNIFVEVDEAMKQERLENLWKRYGGFFIGFLAIIILGTAANAGYSSWKTAKNAAQTDILLNIIDDTTVSQDLTGGLHGINVISAAGILASQNEADKALPHYSSIAKEGDAVGQLAAYMAANISQDLKVIENIASNENDPWRYHAALDAALIEASMNRNYSKARNHISMILSSSNAPKTLIQKAQSLDILYALKEKTIVADK